MDAGPGSVVNDAATMASHEFRVMGTDAQLLIRADEDVARPLLTRAEAELHELSARLSRFQPTSDLEQLNDRGHGTVRGPFADILRAAARATVETGGRFDIGVGAKVREAGYDRSFEQLNKPSEADRARGAQHDLARPAELPDVPAGPSFTIDDAGVVRLRPGVRLDLGGIAKGWAADRLCARLAAASEASCLVNLGGDLAVHVVDGDEPWPVGVSDGERVHSMAVGFGGLATSGQDRRVWHAAGGTGLLHHVFDPRTGSAAETDVLRVTVVAPSAMQAEVWATSLMLAGFARAGEEAAQRDLACVIVPVAGDARFTGALAAFGDA
ncbi:MAG: ApbE family lipoprotein [Thermoleophilia bacterium]|nr:ApbE family lipoprotein [Thermoleophilia bacterium]